MKYIFYFVLLVSLSISAFADTDTPATNELPNPESHLDSPVPVTTPPPAQSTTIFGIELHQNVGNALGYEHFNNIFSAGLNNISISGILNILQDLHTRANVTGVGGSFYSEFNGGSFTQGTQINQFQNNIGSFFNTFSQGAELLTMQLGAGDKTFLSTNGDSFSASAESFYSDDQEFNTTNLTLYAGRFTTLNTPTPNYGQGEPDSATSLMTVTIDNNKYEISAFHSTSPIVLDMDDDQKLEASNGQWLPHQMQANVKFAQFDLNGDGFDEVVEWVGPNDGILVRYNGGVMNGFNMFGTPGGFEHGFEKLSAFDKNNDQKLSEGELDGLSVWQDKNGNAKVDSGEVRSLQVLGITELGTQHKYMMSYFVQNGKKKLVWDWFPVMQMAKKVRK